ncbi:DUF3618 domain-containing protein [Streptomyces sp. NBC_01476]|uniref:DUF3618 domain-containing protein n=1 Tax=Streptomyces sp. NBC_01476 TaxID=2903881 RepID=UPI002E30D4AB|nr:DUF3618 domain-containing protein [Streptomyces sp. NBC_01476]
MTQDSPGKPDSAGRHTDPALAELEAQIDKTREQLGETVEELAAKADVPARAKAKAHQTADRVRATAQRAEAKVTAAGHEAAGRITGAKEKAADKVTAAKEKAAGSAGAARDEATGKVAGASEAVRSSGSHLAGSAHDAGAKAGAKLSRVSDDQWRGTYLPLAAGFTAAAAAGAILWLKHRSDH